jgi:hypothetical protein
LWLVGPCNSIYTMEDPTRVFAMAVAACKHSRPMQLIAVERLLLWKLLYRGSWRGG